jgi:hypothetical protein
VTSYATRQPTFTISNHYLSGRSINHPSSYPYP